jgi:hypothetical protein
MDEGLMSVSLESDAVIVKLSTEVIVTKYVALAACVVVAVLAGVLAAMVQK